MVKHPVMAGGTTDTELLDHSHIAKLIDERH
jgi:hypothetical protein